MTKKNPLTDELKASRDGIKERIHRWEACLNSDLEWRNIRGNVMVSEDDQLRDIKSFTHSMSIGVYPSAETLLNVAQAFAAYLDGAKLSLDSAFKVKPKPKSGTPVKQQTALRLRSEVLWLMAEQCVRNNWTPEKAAETVCSDLNIDKPEPESYVRYYRKRGKQFEEEVKALDAYLADNKRAL
jgi:hypothetical protein